jgi:hypothetical protein
MTRLLSAGLVVAVATGVACTGAGGAAPGGGGETAYTAPRTADGQPDLQGFWTNTTYTPVERPAGVTKEFYTQAEAAEIEKKAAAVEGEQTEPGTAADVHYDFTQFQLDRSQGGVASNVRTSMIVDPPDGRLPPLSEEGKRRTAERAEARKRAGGPYDSIQNMALSVRCILMDRAGPPMLPGAYNNNYQIIQTRDHVMILVEMIHDARIIPLDGRAAIDSRVQQWMGSSRGRWEGDTLVVETTNFTPKTAFRGATEHMRLVERFTRTADDTIQYRFTVEDPSMWTRAWTAELPMKKTIGPLFEHACHEGNYGAANILAGVRADEKRAAAR